MNLVRNQLKRYPRLKKYIKAPFYFIQGVPPVYYTEISPEFIRECVNKPDPVILEIGCNSGSHTLWFLDAFANPQIHCFEPDPRAINRFKKKVGQRNNVTLYEIALSDREGEITFHQSDGQRDERQVQQWPEGWDFSGSIRKPKEHLKEYPWVTFERSIAVKTATLDGWCREHNIDQIDFIWMDVQGAEMDVIKGGREALSKTHYLYTEYGTKELYEGQVTLKQLLKHLPQFKALIRYPNDILLQSVRFPFKRMQHWPAY
jgi:FkbM family methyltransferase